MMESLNNSFEIKKEMPVFEERVEEVMAKSQAFEADLKDIPVESIDTSTAPAWRISRVRKEFVEDLISLMKDRKNVN